MILNLGGEEIQVVSPGTVTDPYSGEPGDSWAVGDVTTRPVLTIAPPEPRPTDEPVADARNAVRSGWTLYLPADDPITRLDRVRVRGVEFPVQGDPARYEFAVEVQAFGTRG